MVPDESADDSSVEMQESEMTKLRQDSSYTRHGNLTRLSVTQSQVGAGGGSHDGEDATCSPTPSILPKISNSNNQYLDSEADFNRIPFDSHKRGSSHSSSAGPSRKVQNPDMGVSSVFDAPTDQAKKEASLTKSRD